MAIWAWRAVSRTITENARASITRDRYSNPVSAKLVSSMGLDHWMAFSGHAAEFERSVAPFKALPAGLDSLSMSNSTPSSANAAAALPESMKPVPMTEWLPQLANAYHLMLAAETGGGKSTLAKTVLLERIKAGDEVVIIDPHGSDWFSLTRYGAGRNYVEVKAALKAVYAEMNRRYEEREAGVKEFRRLTVLVDEVPAIFENATTRDTWKMFAKLLGSEARKVNISCILMTQSPLVQDIGVNSSMRRNFSLVALDMPSIITLVQSLQQDRSIIEQARGTQYPAAAAFSGEVFVLDRSTMNLDPQDPGGDYEWSVCLSETSSRAAKVEDLDADRQTGTMTPAEKFDLIRALRRSGKTRDEARELLAAYGSGLDNDDWTLAGK
jgi:hypothetical protein